MATPREEAQAWLDKQILRQDKVETAGGNRGEVICTDNDDLYLVKFDEPYANSWHGWIAPSNMKRI